MWQNVFCNWPVAGEVAAFGTKGLFSPHWAVFCQVSAYGELTMWVTAAS